MSVARSRPFSFSGSRPSAARSTAAKSTGVADRRQRFAVPIAATVSPAPGSSFCGAAPAAALFAPVPPRRRAAARPAGDSCRARSGGACQSWRRKPRIQPGVLERCLTGQATDRLTVHFGKGTVAAPTGRPSRSFNCEDLTLHAGDVLGRLSRIWEL
jgi:hypothetical protein